MQDARILVIALGREAEPPPHRTTAHLHHRFSRMSCEEALIQIDKVAMDMEPSDDALERLFAEVENAKRKHQQAR